MKSAFSQTCVRIRFSRLRSPRSARFAARGLSMALFAAMALAGCADNEESAFDPSSDRSPPEVSEVTFVNEGQQEYVTWTASEPVRAVFEFGQAEDELWHHAYAGSKQFETSGVIKLVGAASASTLVGRLRLTDRAGNEALSAPSEFTTGTVAPEDLLYFAMVDVGWGDALFLRAPDGTTTLIDAGHPADGIAVRRFLEAKGVHGLDFASLSHVHEDHIGGFYGDSFALLDGLFQTYNPGVTPFPCDIFLDIEDKTATNGPYGELEDALESHPSFGEQVFLRWGASSLTEPALRWGTGLRVDLLSAGRKSYLLPDFILQAENGSVVNNDSMIYRVQYGSFVLLLMGDGEFTTEQFLQNEWPEEVLGASILKVGHHGSSDSSSERFLKFVDPLVAFIPNALSENPGVETSTTLGRIRNLGADYFASDRAIPNRSRLLSGVRADVEVWTDGDAFTVVAIPTKFE